MVEVHSKPSGHSMKTVKQRSNVNIVANTFGTIIKIKIPHDIQFKSFFL